MKKTSFSLLISLALLATFAVAVSSVDHSPRHLGAALIAQETVRVGSPTRGVTEDVIPDGLRAEGYDFSQTSDLDDFADAFIDELSSSGEDDFGGVMSSGIEYLQRFFSRKAVQEAPIVGPYFDQALEEGIENASPGPFEQVVCRQGLQVAEDLIRAGALYISAPSSEVDASRRSFFQNAVKQLGADQACALMSALGSPDDAYLDQLLSLSKNAGAQDAAPGRFERLVCEYGQDQAREIISRGVFAAEESSSEEKARARIFETVLLDRGEEEACSMMRLLSERGTMYREMDLYLGDEILYHPSGVPLNWASFYKFLAEKEKSRFQDWRNGFDAIREITGVDVSEDAWFKLYELWFRDQYPEFPHYFAEDFANPDVVRILFGGLPPGVYAASLSDDVTGENWEDVLTEYDIQESTRGAAPASPGDDLTDVLVHPNGQTLSWAMLYKYLFLQKNPGVTVSEPASGAWYLPYEQWFRTEYPSFPASHPADPALPEVVESLYGGLPEGVGFDRRIVEFQGGGLTDLSRQINQLALTNFVTDESLGLYASAYLANEDVQQLLYGADGEAYTWAGFWPAVVAYEASRPSDEARTVLEDSVSPVWRAWFRTYYPDLEVPSGQALVTVAEARFFLGGDLPAGSYGVDVDLQRSLRLLENFRSISMGSLTTGVEGTLQSQGQRREDGVPVYDIAPLDEGQEQIFGDVAAAIAGMTEVLEVFDQNARDFEDYLALQENLFFQSEIFALLTGEDDEYGAYLTLFDQGADEEAYEYLKFLTYVPVFPNFLDGVETLRGLFLGAEGLEEEIVELPTADLVTDLDALPEVDVDPNEICSQTEEGDVIIEDRPDCRSLF